jgi:hypothetical protein
MNRRLLLAVLTLASAGLLYRATADAALLAAPLALVFVVAAFLWSLDRAAPVAAGPPDPCPGCAAGCVECRERLDVG